jgi:hypothetical protein
MELKDGSTWQSQTFGVGREHGWTFDGASSNYERGLKKTL